MSGKNFDVFISYRHSDGKDKAISLEANFEKAGCRTFRDDNELRRGAFDKKIEIAVLDAPVFVMVLTSDYFERCNQEGDWVRREIDLAIENGKVIIPINYNGVLKGVPDYLDEEFREKIGCHTFIALHTDTSFKATLKEIIDNDIKPNVSIVVNNNNRAKLSVKTDANCELIEDDEIIATLQEGTTKQIFVEKGEHEFIARSTEYNDIEQSIEKLIDDIKSKYLLKIELANQVQERKKAIAQEQEAEKDAIKRREEEKEKRKEKRKEWWGRNKRKFWSILLSVAIILTGVFIYLNKDESLKTLEGHYGYVYSVAYSPDGRRIISGSSDETIKIWDANTGQYLKTLEGHLDGVTSVAYSPDGTKIISGSDDGTIKIWDINTGQCLKTLEGHPGWVYSVAYSPDGAKIISASSDETIKIWDANTGECLQTLEGHLENVYSVAYSPDGTKIISGSWDKTIKIWDANTGRCLKTLEGHLENVYSVAYSPDGTKIISGSSDETIKIWDANTGQCLKTLEGHSGWVRSVAYSPDGTKIISGSEDKTIKIWDANTGECLEKLEGHSNDVRSVAYSPDGKRIISGSVDKTIKIWGVE
ncbi:MAG: TIR domain-containing protein [Bacteroidales bacterium]|nr:TIR domain-containing protein [Bacteroidales bacterium]